jgi:hypothetical protein
MASNPFIQRLVEYYRRCNRDVHLSCIWDWIIKDRHKELHLALSTGDEAAIARLLNGIGLNALATGILGNDGQFALEELGKSVGCIPYFNPQQPSVHAYESESLASCIERESGVPLSFPSVTSITNGMKVGARTIQPRLFSYMDAFISMKRFLKEVPRCVLEIGPGLGFLGFLLHTYYLNRPPFLYCSLDLPTMSVIQAHIFKELFGENSVWFDGESGDASTPLRLFPSTGYSRLRQYRFQVVFNMDSFPEIPDQDKSDYLRLCAEVLESGGLFFSINHESNSQNQIRVFETFTNVSGFQLVSRHSHLVRPGYVEEIYQRV